ncbi:hypothetical protein A3Q56_04862 [Intoshia linei]|uniref:Uncharacterized protein n=1 Tax=Intoshia linei TaxID=1819745 RepID=A0A177AZF1_9BILA|nr:hypothetical protein A3Q56_04862 [Intoshia linei]
MKLKNLESFEIEIIKKQFQLQDPTKLKNLKSFEIEIIKKQPWLQEPTNLKNNVK